MSFTEINLFGVYVAPISVMIVAAWVVMIGLRRFAARFGFDTRHGELNVQRSIRSRTAR